MTPEEKQAHDALVLELKSQIDSKLAESKNASSAELVELKSKVADLEAKSKDAKPADYDKLKEEHIALMAEFKSFKEEGGKKQELRKSIADQLKSQITADKDKWTAFKNGESKSFSFELDMKAAAVMLESTNLGGSAYLPFPERVAGFTDIARNRPVPIEAYANTSGTSSAVITWVNKVDPEGAAAFIAEGVVKPLIDFNFETETSTARKVADAIKVSTEMLEDIDFMAAAIENELRYQVDMAVDAALLTGDGIAPNLKGITEYAGGYVLTTVETTTPNMSDAIMAAATQVRSLNFMPTHAFVNTIDAANMELTKDGEGRYVIPPFQSADGLTISGLQVVVSNQIPVGSVLVADMMKYVVRNYKSFSIRYGWENDDFRKNLVTVIGERRLHAYASDNNTGAFVYDTFDNIKTAITAAP